MPDPRHEQWLQHVRTGDAGGFTPRNAEEAGQEFDRLVAAGMGEDEALEVLSRRASPGPKHLDDFGSTVWGNLKGLAGAVPDIVRTGLGLADPATFTRGAQAFAREAESRGQAAGDAFRSGDTLGGVENLGRTLATLPEAAGIPVSGIADAIAGGRYGEAAGHGASALALRFPGKTATALRHPFQSTKAALRAPFEAVRGMRTGIQELPSAPSAPPPPPMRAVHQFDDARINDAMQRLAEKKRLHEADLSMSRAAAAKAQYTPPVNFSDELAEVAVPPQVTLAQLADDARRSLRRRQPLEATIPPTHETAIGDMLLKLSQRNQGRPAPGSLPGAHAIASRPSASLQNSILLGGDDLAQQRSVGMAQAQLRDALRRRP